MGGDKDRSRGKSAAWGVFLILLGAAFLLDRFGLLGVRSVWQFWPLVFLWIAGNHAFERRLGSAVMFLLMGTWFLAVNFDWWGLSYRNSWGLLLVAVGAGMVVKALTGEEAPVRRRREAGHE